MIASQQSSLATPLPVCFTVIARVHKLASVIYPFLEYAVQNVLCHADAAAGCGIQQNAFLKEFPLKKWEILNSHLGTLIPGQTPDMLSILINEQLWNLVQIWGVRSPSDGIIFPGRDFWKRLEKRT